MGHLSCHFPSCGGTHTFTSLRGSPGEWSFTDQEFTGRAWGCPPVILILGHAHLRASRSGHMAGGFRSLLGCEGQCPPIRLPLPCRGLRLFFRFRMGCSGLPIDTGRPTRPHPTPRAQRVFVKCASQSVCDEYHVVFECPALAPFRGQYSSLFTPATRSMVRFMWQLDTCAVAMFVAHALRFTAGT